MALGPQLYKNLVKKLNCVERVTWHFAHSFFIGSDPCDWNLKPYHGEETDIVDHILSGRLHMIAPALSNVIKTYTLKMKQIGL